MRLLDFGASLEVAKSGLREVRVLQAAGGEARAPAGVTPVRPDSPGSPGYSPGSDMMGDTSPY